MAVRTSSTTCARSDAILATGGGTASTSKITPSIFEAGGHLSRADVRVNHVGYVDAIAARAKKGGAQLCACLLNLTAMSGLSIRSCCTIAALR